MDIVKCSLDRILRGNIKQTISIISNIKRFHSTSAAAFKQSDTSSASEYSLYELHNLFLSPNSIEANHILIIP